MRDPSLRQNGIIFLRAVFAHYKERITLITAVPLNNADLFTGKDVLGSGRVGSGQQFVLSRGSGRVRSGQEVTIISRVG